MPSVFRGVLTGSGTVSLSGGLVTPTDIDYWVDTFSNLVQESGDPGRRLFKRVGWCQFFQSGATVWTGQPDEAVSDAIWFNFESADVPVQMTRSDQADILYYNVANGCSVQLNVSA